MAHDWNPRIWKDEAGRSLWLQPVVHPELLSETLSQIRRKKVLSCHRLKIDRANHLWTKTYKNISQNKPFLLINFCLEYFVTMTEMLGNPQVSEF